MSEIFFEECKLIINGNHYYRGNRSCAWFALASRLDGTASGISERLPQETWDFLERIAELERELADAQEELAEAKDELNDRRKFSYAVELALEGFKGDYIEIIKELVAAKKNAEPFGYFQYATHLDAWVQNRDSNKGVAFYTTPQPQREWVGLTDEEILNLQEVYDVTDTDYERAIEAKLKEKNT